MGPKTHSHSVLSRLSWNGSFPSRPAQPSGTGKSAVLCKYSIEWEKELRLVAFYKAGLLLPTPEQIDIEGGRTSPTLNLLSCSGRILTILKRPFGASSPPPFQESSPKREAGWKWPLGQGIEPEMTFWGRGTPPPPLSNKTIPSNHYCPVDTRWNYSSKDLGRIFWTLLEFNAQNILNYT